MLITCPRCETTFSLPDDLYQPGKKARCSQCSLVFPMPGPEEQAGPAPEQEQHEPEVTVATKPSSGGALRAIVIGLVCVVLLALLGYGGYLVYGAFYSTGTTTQPQVAAEEPVDPGLKALIDSIGLDQIRQYQVENPQIGRLMVIQGLAINNSSTNKDYIELEALLRDGNGDILATVQQFCGVEPTLFQLRTLNEQELRETLNSRTTILINNVNVPPGGKVPFVVIFPNPSENTRTFELKVINVRESQ